MTIISTYKPGTIVNIEYDLIAKYILNMLSNFMESNKNLAEILKDSPYFNGGE